VVVVVVWWFWFGSGGDDDSGYGGSGNSGEWSWNGGREWWKVHGEGHDEVEVGNNKVDNEIKLNKFNKNRLIWTKYKQS